MTNNPDTSSKKVTSTGTDNRGYSSSYRSFPLYLSHAHETKLPKYFAIVNCGCSLLALLGLLHFFINL
jgi:hypothetical protein